MSVLVGIAGGTGSGKTSLAVKVRDGVGEDRCLLLAQDAYYKDGSTLTKAAQAAINYDHPDAFDTTLLVQDLRDLRAGRPVPCITYDHASYSRRVLPDPLKPKPVVILEGTLKTLKRHKDEVREVQHGFECGMAFENYDDIKVGDVIECFDVEEVQATL